MKKTTAYARKQRRTGGTWNGAEWLNTLQRSTGYTTEPPPGSWIPGGTQDAADKAIKRVKDAFDSLKVGMTPAANEEHFDLLTYALGVSCIRAGVIAGKDPADNIMLPPLIAANAAMRSVLARRRKWGKWEIIAAEVEAVDYAIEIYETIVLASSPAQMSEAVDARMRAIKGQTLETVA